MGFFRMVLSFLTGLEKGYALPADSWRTLDTVDLGKFAILLDLDVALKTRSQTAPSPTIGVLCSWHTPCKSLPRVPRPCMW